MNVALSLDPNIKFDPTNPTPTWNHWGSDDTEMLFNKTSTNEPDIRAVRTDSGLLERCAYVLLSSVPSAVLYVIGTLRSPFSGSGIALQTLLVSKYLQRMEICILDRSDCSTSEFDTGATAHHPSQTDSLLELPL